MEALDDLLSDSDYEGPASKLGFGPRRSASAAGPGRYGGFSGAAAHALEPIEEPDEASVLPTPSSRHAYTPNANEAWDEDYGHDDNVYGQEDGDDASLDDEHLHDFEDEAFAHRQRLWNLSALGIGADKEEQPLDDDDAIEAHGVNGFSGQDHLADLCEFDDIEELERDIKASAATTSSKEAESWWAAGAPKAGSRPGYGGFGNHSHDDLEHNDHKTLSGAEAGLADLLDDSKPAPAWAPPSAQTTAYEGGSQSPHSEEVTAEASWRSSASSPRSAEIRRSIEAELSAKSALISGFERYSTDTGCTALDGSATGASPGTHAACSSNASPAGHGACDSTVAAEGVPGGGWTASCAFATPAGSSTTYAGSSASRSIEESIGAGGDHPVAAASPRTTELAAKGRNSVASRDTGNSGASSAGVAAGSAPISGNVASDPGKPRSFLKKGTRNPRSVIPVTSSAASPGLAKANSMPRLMPRASSSPPSATRTTSDHTADSQAAPARAATIARKAPIAQRPRQDFQVEVRVPLAVPFKEGEARFSCSAGHDGVDPSDTFTAAADALLRLNSGSEEEDYCEEAISLDAQAHLRNGGLVQPALSPNALSPGFGGTSFASASSAPASRGSSAARGPVGSYSSAAPGAAAFAAAVCAHPVSRATASHGSMSKGDTRGSCAGHGADPFGPADVVSGNLEDEWADSLPWDCRRTDLDLDLEFDQDVAPASGRYAKPLSGEPPTSRVVKSYFNPAPSASSGRPTASRDKLDSAAPRHSHWEGDDAYSALYGDTGGQPKRSSTTSDLRGRSHAADHLDENGNNKGAFEQEDKMHLELLQQQIKKYEKEADLLKKLRAQVEQSERDLAREREKLHREVEAERQALHLEFDAEQVAMKRERKRLMQSAEKQRQQLAEDRDAAEERKRLGARTEQLEEELREKEKRWTRTVDRLQRQVGDLTTKNRELEEEVRRAGVQMQNAQSASGRSTPAGTGSARGRRASSATRATTPTPKLGARRQGAGAESDPPWQAPSRALRPSGSVPSLQKRPEPSALGTEYSSGSSRPSAQGRQAQLGRPAQGLHEHESLSAEEASGDVREVQTHDGRTRRTYWDGRSEIEFANGLKKVLHPDGRTQVYFQNGDEKEMRPDGVIVYSYFSTKAVQTTLPDGCELYHFQDGQFESRHADGSTEIHFPNGTTKRIQADGSEEVCFPDGTVQRSTN